MTILVHPGTGGEFDAPDRAVPTWQRSGWVPKDQLTAGGPAGVQAETGGTTAQDQES